MLLAYVDETYSPDAMALAAVVLDERAVGSLTMRLDAIVHQAAQWTIGLDAQAELHAHELVMGKGVWKPYAPSIRARAAVYRRALEATHDCVRVVLAERLTPGPRRGSSSAKDLHAQCLRDLLRRLDAMALADGERCIVIIDDVNYRDDLREAVLRDPHPTFVDTVHFAESRTSRPLQSADLSAYLVRRQLGWSSLPARFRAVDRWLWQAIAPKVDLVDRAS